VHGSAGRASLFEDGLDLAGKGKTTCLSLGVDELVADGDLEDSAGPFDELGFDAELLLDLLRQTGGAGEVVSDSAVLDGDARNHETRLLSLPIISLSLPGFPGPDLGEGADSKTRISSSREESNGERGCYCLQGAARAPNGTSRLEQGLDCCL
jgi:hypothetical protein